MAFATALLSGELKVDDCPEIQDDKYKQNYEKLSELIAPIQNASETGMIIHEEKCTGCGNCVVACPVNVAEDPKGTGTGLAPKNDRVILKVVNGVVQKGNIHNCRRFGENKILCNACIETCPTKAIEFV